MYLKTAAFLFGIMLIFGLMNMPASGEKHNIAKDILLERKQTDDKILRGEPSEFSAFWSRYLRPGESVVLGVRKNCCGPDLSEKFVVDKNVGKGVAHAISIKFNTGALYLSEYWTYNEPQDSSMKERKIKWGERIKLGVFSLIVSEQSGMARIIAYDPKQPKRLGFKGLKYFPPDLTYRFIVPLNKQPNPKMIKLQSSRGLEKEYLEYGTVNFALEGKGNRLFVYVPANNSANPAEYFVPFRDATSGKESYKLARYVDLIPEKENKNLFVLDFNMAYNPSCAYTSEHFNCPIPPKNNTLLVPIRAGEKKYK